MSEELGDFGDSYKVQFIDQSGYVAKDYSGYLDSSGILRLGNVNLKGGQYVVNVEGKNGKLTPFKANVANKPTRINANRVKSPNVLVEEEYVNIDLDKIKNERIQENFGKLPQTQINSNAEENYIDEINNQQDQKIKIESIEQLDKKNDLIINENTSSDLKQEDSFVKLPSNQQNLNNSSENFDDLNGDLQTEQKIAPQSFKPTLQQISQNANVINSNNFSKTDSIYLQNDSINKILSEEQSEIKNNNTILKTETLDNYESQTQKNNNSFSDPISLNNESNGQNFNQTELSSDKFNEENKNSDNEKSDTYTDNLIENKFNQIPGQALVSQNETVSIQNQAGLTQNEYSSIQNQTGSIQNQTGSIQNQTGSIQNQTGSIQNQTGSIQNQTGSIQNQTGSIQNQTGLTQNEYSSIQNQTGSNQNQTGQNEFSSIQNQTGSIQNQTGSNQNQTGQNEFSSNQNQTGSIQNQTGSIQNQTGSNQNQTGSNQNQTGSNQNQTGQNEFSSIQNQTGQNEYSSNQNQTGSNQNQTGFQYKQDQFENLNDTNTIGINDKLENSNDFNYSKINQSQISNNLSESSDVIQTQTDGVDTNDKYSDSAKYETLPQANQNFNQNQSTLTQDLSDKKDIDNGELDRETKTKITTDNNFIYRPQAAINNNENQNTIGTQSTIGTTENSAANQNYQALRSNTQFNNYENKLDDVDKNNSNNVFEQSDKTARDLNSNQISNTIQSDSSNQENYNSQLQFDSLDNQNRGLRVEKLPGQLTDLTTDGYYKTGDNKQLETNTPISNNTSQIGRTVSQFSTFKNNQENAVEQITIVDENKQQNTTEKPTKINRNDIFSKLNESFNKASKIDEIEQAKSENQELNNPENNSKFLDDKGNLKRVILEALPQQSFQQPSDQESAILNPRVSGFNVADQNDYIEEDDLQQDQLPIRKRIKYITIGGNVIAALQSVELPENSDSIINEKSINEQVKQQINDETKPLEDQVYSSLLKEREALQSKLMDLENNKAYLRKAEENIQNQLVYLVTNDQVADSADESASSPLNQIIQNFINEDRTTVENFKQETINQAIQAISGQKEIDEILLRQRIERELRYEFNQMQLDHEQKMKIIYRRMIESMYSDLLNS